MQADMHNLFPAAIGGQYGECKFDVLFKQKRARIKEEIRGVIARDYLYFNKQYGMKLSKQEMKKFSTWDKLYPPNMWEIVRNKRILKTQGNSNYFIDGYLKKSAKENIMEYPNKL